MTSTLQISRPTPPEAHWTLPAHLAGLKGDTFADALVAVAIGDADALAQHEAAAKERARHALPEMLLAGARKELRTLEAEIIGLIHASGTTVGDLEAAFLRRQAASQRVAAFGWRPSGSNVRRPAQDRLAAAVRARVLLVGWCAKVGSEYRLWSPEQEALGMRRAAAATEHPLARAREAAALLERADDTGSQQRRDNARALVADIEGSIAQARVLLGIDDNHAEQGAVR